MEITGALLERKKMALVPKYLYPSTEQETRVGDQIASPQTPRFTEEAVQPFKTGFLHQ